MAKLKGRKGIPDQGTGGRTTWEYGTEFENCMRRVFGNNAYHIAGSCLDENVRQKWVEKIIKQLIRDTQDLDTTQDHRERLSYLIEALQQNSILCDIHKINMPPLIFFTQFHLLS
ncbi:MAG: hypothetical protein AB1632_15090 [Nitrospirota bacterium]